MDNKGLDYNIDFSRVGDYFLLSYKDINNFNWDIGEYPSYSGGLTSMDPYIKKNR